MGNGDDIFGGFFDFNGDGKTTWDEEWIAYKIIEDVERETRAEDSNYSPVLLDDEDIYAWRETVEENDYDIDPCDFETEEEYLDAIDEAEETYGWRNYVAENNYDIDPREYETEEEYLDAVETAEEETVEVQRASEYYNENIPVSVAIDLNVEMDALDRLDAVKESDFPNKIVYDAFCEKVKTEGGLMFFCDEETKDECLRRCNFILENYENLIAANYLSVETEEFLYVQAVTDHFDLPVPLPKKVNLTELLKRVYKKDKELTFAIWRWCIDNFGPYTEYQDDKSPELSVIIIADGGYIGSDFIEKTVDYIIEHPEFGRKLMKLAPWADEKYGQLFILLIRRKQVVLARELFAICVEKDFDAEDFACLVRGMLGECLNYEETNSMKMLEQHMFPIVKTINDSDIRIYVDEWQEEIDEYYRYFEENDDD